MRITKARRKMHKSISARQQTTALWISCSDHCTMANRKWAANQLKPKKQKEESNQNKAISHPCIQNEKEKANKNNRRHIALINFRKISLIWSFVFFFKLASIQSASQSGKFDGSEMVLHVSDRNNNNNWSTAPWLDYKNGRCSCCCISSRCRRRCRCCCRCCCYTSFIHLFANNIRNAGHTLFSVRVSSGAAADVV